MQNWLQKLEVLPDEQTLFCMEYTGIYNTGLVHYLVKAKAALWVEMPLRIKKAGGFERGNEIMFNLLPFNFLLFIFKSYFVCELTAQ